ncbi:MAG: peptide chain release factor N(5)-glutamine methyltransferase [Acidobacteria bacterium]|nr:peptide chain release factor N(5)-glutamine methyltransferase [Acidobacteriota bacterium]
MKFLSIREALLFGATRLRNAGLKKPVRDARILLSFALNIEKPKLMANLNNKIDEKNANVFISLVKRREKHEPIQYITGVQPFYSTAVKVGKGCLIPRAETEFVVEETLKIASDFDCPKIADLGCGSGAIIKAVSQELKRGVLIGVEKSKDSLFWARKNLSGEKNCKLILGDFGSAPFLKDIDIIACNPPYLTKEEYKKLPKEIKLYEPKSALLTKGIFYFYESALNFAKWALRTNGFIVFEIGSEQAKRHLHFSRISESFQICKKIRDYAGRLRVVVLRKLR